MSAKKTDRPEPVPTENWLHRSEPDQHGWIKETHPSYGTIGVSRVSGDTSLFDSELKHHHHIRITIKNAERVIDGTHQFITGEANVAEVWMSEAQFAQLMTQPNQGDGVACTIHYSAGDKGQPWVHPSWGTRPEPPAPERFELKFHREADERAKIIIDSLKALDETVTAMVDGEVKPNKGTLKDLLSRIQSARRQIESNIPYVQEVARQQLEKLVSNAVIEVESYISQSLQAKGLSHLQAEAPQLRLLNGEKNALPATTDEEQG